MNAKEARGEIDILRMVEVQSFISRLNSRKDIEKNVQYGYSYVRLLIPEACFIKKGFFSRKNPTQEFQKEIDLLRKDGFKVTVEYRDLLIRW